MRPFLALDTATEHVVVAVGDLDEPGSVVAHRAFEAPRAANEVLLRTAEDVLAEAGCEVRALRAVACGRGPGSFTGVRIAVATAKGLAHGLRVPLVGFGTSDAVAQRVSWTGLVGVVTDAMRGEVYPALFSVDETQSVTRMTSDRVSRPEDAATEWAALGETVLVTGTGLRKHRTVFERFLGSRAVFAESSVWAPDGPSLVAAAWSDRGDRSLAAIAGLSLHEAFDRAHPGLLLPVYTRLSDAEEAERRRAGLPNDPGRSGVAGPPEGGARP
ncbi:MAG: tRNA (adenosine(37)-N6)-threonylcarbamoyltransferase complex dimerization subunit type 1 TsaB [Coriobacteriia bacterium]|nr:tRNA (adenosine(37)-N6)-threonylcarbamoyltransferase complex dimerization subunit type 1 TsaB [Coriobacteriia bacterium]